jgi:transcriptional regulator with XRE-family HTH domain
MDHRAISAAHRIKSAADAQKISLRQLAERSGVGYGTLQGALATGTRELKLTHLYALADVLGLDVRDLLGSAA